LDKSIPRLSQKAGTRVTKAYQRFFAELKRRRVFHTATVYGGVTFVVIQAADFMLPALRLPQTVSTVIAVLALVGFPVSIALAWIYDVTDSGLRVTEPSSEAELVAIVAQSRMRRWPAGIAAALGMGLFSLGIWLELGGSGADPDPATLFSTPSVPSVAVLPFLDFGAEEDGHYLGEGIAAELMDALRGIPGLRVAARTSAFSFEPGEADLGSVFRDLKVAACLEGSVNRSEGKVEVALRLMEVGKGDPTWTRTFHLPEEGFLDALDGVAWSVAEALGATTAGTDQGRLVRPHTRSLPAYTEYLRGRSEARVGSRDALEAAIARFHRAVLLDPGFSEAWAALATGYVLLPEAGGPPILEVLPLAQAALDRAMGPGSETADGFAASAYLKWAYLWDLPAAEADFLRSIQLDPANPVSRSWYSQFLATNRRWEEAIHQAELAVEMDPRSPAAFMTLGLALMCGKRDGAPEAFQRALELSPEIHPAAYVLGGLLAMRGDLEGAAQAFRRFSSVTGMDFAIFEAYLGAVSDHGKRPEVVAALQEPRFFGAVQGAELLAQLGENEASLDLLERAVEERSPYLPWINAMPQYDGLRPDPRFRAILAWVRFAISQ